MRIFFPFPRHTAVEKRERETVKPMWTHFKNTKTFEAKKEPVNPCQFALFFVSSLLFSAGEKMSLLIPCVLTLALLSLPRSTSVLPSFWHFCEKRIKILRREGRRRERRGEKKKRKGGKLSWQPTPPTSPPQHTHISFPLVSPHAATTPLRSYVVQ